MVLSLDRWIGKIAVVTGASSGIGAAIANILVENGINVVGIARRVEVIEENAKKLDGKKGKLYSFKADIRKEEDIVKAFKWIEENLGHVHILINCAGLLKEQSLYAGKAEVWKDTFDINVIGLCIATREAVKTMKSNNIKGHIIHVNSVFGHKVVNFPNGNVYAASKYAVTALAETLRHEFNEMGDKIKITSLSPGLVASEMTIHNKESSEEKQNALKALPILQAQDIAEAIGYVLSTPENVQINELTITPVGEKF